MSRMKIQQAVIGLSAATLLLTAGCASQDPYGVAAVPPDPCPSGMKPLCVEYVGKRLRCYCSTGEELKEILDPNYQN